MFISEPIRNTAISVLLTAVITWFLTRFQARTARLGYWSRVERIAVSSNDPLFGAVAVTWGGNPTRNLYLVTIEVENASVRDLANVPLKVYVAADTNLLSEKSIIVNTPLIVEWSQEFRDFIKVPAGLAPTPNQQNRFHHSRDYTVPVFNRGQLLQFTYLCTRPNDDKLPEVFIHTQVQGARLKRENRSTLVYGVPNPDALVRGLIVSSALVIVATRWIHPVWVATVVSFIVGLTVLPLGVGCYKIARYLRKMILG